ncbi:MFS transporter [Rhizobium tumorigenes]|uniref:MFS transporter n=1 Tax=Rhizobium tumorigenes TaxID=2041385 RepID=A0AAF1KRW7_9HYPH|nr:MFS transporter [Rhizobium tumorigenes]WFR94451.1 MFS transporter [Rhizobium tumorigenes]WFR99932.1 MFS transporter [Rhizobium tumorigenes]
MSDQTYPSASRPAAPNFRTIALIVASSMFMEQLDATVLATALPTMARDFNVSPPAMSIALTSYLLSLAIFIPASGKIADRFGSRTVFRSAIAVFVFGSILCAQAPTLSFLVVARLIQGIGGAMMMPVGRLVLMRSVDRKDLVSAMSWLLVPALIGPIVGPPVGGMFVTYLDWRWIFYINVPIGILGFVLVSIFIEDVKGPANGPFDLSGFILSGISLGSLLFGFEMSSRSGEGSMAIMLIAIGVLFGIAYLRHARKHPSPIMDFSLMRVPSFGASVIAGSLTRITQGAQPFLIPLMLQLGFGMSAAAAGRIVIATAIGSMAMKALQSKVLKRFGFRNSLMVFGVIGTLGYGTCAAFRPDWPMPLIFVILMLCGFFMSFQFTAYNTIAYDEIDRDRMSAATSFYTTFQQLMLSLGICVAALALHGSMFIQDHQQAELNDFSAAFIVVTLISLSATIWNSRFSKTAGAEMSGYKSKRPSPISEH